MSSSSMSVIELEKPEKHAPDPFVIVLEEPDPRLDRLQKGVELLQEHTNDLGITWRDTHSRIKEETWKGDSYIERVSGTHDASRKLWTILGTTFLFLATLRLIKGGTAAWRWYKRLQSDLGDDQEQSSTQSQRPRRTHPRNWAVRN